MSVDGADVTEAEFLEEHAARERRLDAVTHLVDGLIRHVADERNHFQQVVQMPLRILIERAEPGAVEIPCQAADARADRHFVVVENDKKVLAQTRGIIHRLKDDAGRQGAVADDGDAVPVRMAQQIVGHLETRDAGDTAPGMAGHEQVVQAFFRVGIAHRPAARADRLETRIAAGDELVRINLMPGIPDEAVLAEIERQVQGQAKFDDAEIAGKVSGPNAEDAHQFVAHLLRQVGKLLLRQLVQIRRRLDLRQQWTAHLILWPPMRQSLSDPSFNIHTG